uniref:Rx N-terminal domain-containing protein n=1 Tax=Oryza rufipogon TaxID=4529 RepID=A0A0E0P4J9_ORYRU
MALEVVAVGWAIRTIGWIVSPMTTKAVNKGIDLLNCDQEAQLRNLVACLEPQLRRQMEHMTSMPYLDKWVQSLRSAFYDAEDIVDIHDYLNLALHMQLCRFGCKPNQVTFFPPSNSNY